MSTAKVTPLNPTRRNRALVAAVVGAMYAVSCYAFLVGHGPTMQAVDFTYPWLAARFVFHGVDPYIAMRTAVTPFQPVFFYPLPAAFFALPIAWLPAQGAAAIFIGLSGGWLAYALSLNGWWRLLVFASAPGFSAANSAQWSPLLVAAALTPAAAWLLMAKPNIALPLLAYQTARRPFVVATVGSALLCVAAFIVLPHWPFEWLATIRAGASIAKQYRSPIATWYGLPLVLAGLRWRDRDARLLLAMACVPQNFFFYDQLPLLLIARTRQQLVALCTISAVAYYLAWRYYPFTGSYVALSDGWMPLVTAGIYWPSLILILRRLRGHSTTL